MQESVQHSGELPERRAISRSKTMRDALVFSSQKDAPVVRGIIVDISPNGMQLRTDQPTAVGEVLDIEVQPRTGGKADTVYAVRGCVVRVEALSAQQYALGIRLSTGKVQNDLFTPSQVEIRDMVETVRGQLRTVSSSAPSVLAYAAHQKGEDTVSGSPIQTPSSKPGRIKRRWGFFWLAVGALLGLLVGWLMWGKGEGQLFFVDARESREGTVFRWTAEEEAEVPERVSRQGNAGGAIHLDLSWAQGVLAAGHPDSARKAFEELLEKPDLSPVETFIARLGRVQSLHLQGAPTASDAALALLSDLPSAPAPWQALAQKVQQAIAAGLPPEMSPKPFQDTLVWAASTQEMPSVESDTEETILTEKSPQVSSPEESTTPADKTPGNTKEMELSPVRLEVSTSAYVLSVFQGEKLLDAFPVGLGRNNATPHGDFTIANKLEWPDWYDRGRVVKAGSKENPLGESWMGLGNAQGAMSYGIHPTKEFDSIGKNQSRGCIRMRPADARKVFAWCSIGTPVHIAP